MSKRDFHFCPRGFVLEGLGPHSLHGNIDRGIGKCGMYAYAMDGKMDGWVNVIVRVGGWVGGHIKV